MMFGTRVRYGISFKINQPGFMIYTRKYYHNFKVTINNQNHEGALGANIKKQGWYVMGKGSTVGIYDQEKFHCRQEFKAPANNDECQVLFITTNRDDSKIGITMGNKGIKDVSIVTDLLVYKMNREGYYELEKARPFEFTFSSPYFCFNYRKDTELLFFTKDELFSWNYLDVNSDRDVIYTSDNALDTMPTMGVFSEDQTKFIVTSFHEVLYVDMMATA